MLLIFSNCESTCVLTEVPASIYDRKTAARPFDTIHDILWCHIIVQSLLEGSKKKQIWLSGKARVNPQKNKQVWCLLRSECLNNSPGPVVTAVVPVESLKRLIMKVGTKSPICDVLSLPPNCSSFTESSSLMVKVDDSTWILICYHFFSISHHDVLVLLENLEN